MTSKLMVNTDVPEEIKMTRVFDAPRRLVIKAMTDAELIKRWLGGTGKRSVVTSAVMDARVGGTYRYVFRRPDGGEFSFSGVIREMSEDRIVMTEKFDDYPSESVVTTTWVETGGKTTMTVVVRFESQQIRDMVLETGMAVGAGESYDALESLVATL
jgi:uncharacterized protein YndB with AHSA1/START domain